MTTLQHFTVHEKDTLMDTLISHAGEDYACVLNNTPFNIYHCMQFFFERRCLNHILPGKAQFLNDVAWVLNPAMLNAISTGIYTFTACRNKHGKSGSNLFLIDVRHPIEIKGEELLFTLPANWAITQHELAGLGFHAIGHRWGILDYRVPHASLILRLQKWLKNKAAEVTYQTRYYFETLILFWSLLS